MRDNVEISDGLKTPKSIILWNKKCFFKKN